MTSPIVTLVGMGIDPRGRRYARSAAPHMNVCTSSSASPPNALAPGPRLSGQFALVWPRRPHWKHGLFSGGAGGLGQLGRIWSVAPQLVHLIVLGVSRAQALVFGRCACLGGRRSSRPRPFHRLMMALSSFWISSGYSSTSASRPDPSCIRPPSSRRLAP